MKPEEIDRAVAFWRNTITCANNNVLELYERPGYQRLSGSNGFPRPVLAGTTLSRVKPALDALDELFQNLPLISAMVTRVAEIRASLPRFWTSEVMLNEIDRLLNGPSIELPPIETPLAQRGLVTAAQNIRTVTPQQLLDAMNQSFEAAKAAILEVDAIWTRLEPDLDGAEEKAAHLRQLAGSLGEVEPEGLASAKARIDALRAKLDTDPLGAGRDFDSGIMPLLSQAERRLNEVERVRNQTHARLVSARTAVKELYDLNQRCVECRGQYQEKIVSTDLLPDCGDRARISDLDQWLTKIEGAEQKGQWRSAGLAMDKWQASADHSRSVDQTAHDAFKSRIDRRAELRGLLAALQAKARAYMLRGVAIDRSTDDAGAEADRLLNCRPTPLHDAELLVANYESALGRVARKQ
jgi:hypothetical protein